MEKERLEFLELAQQLFGAKSEGGRIGYENVSWFNGGLFEDSGALPLDRKDIELVLDTAALDWSEIDASIFGTLFERGLDPDKSSQIGAHYTDRDKIMQIIEPVVIKPWVAEWVSTKEDIASILDKAKTAKSKAARTRLWQQARVPKEADLVCYWLAKAGAQMSAGRTNRIGLATTISIRGGANRKALESSIKNLRIFDAWSDEPWVVEGAAVRVSLVCIANQDDKHTG